MTMRNRNGQDGVAMITVMMIVVVLSLLMVASLNYALQGEPPSRRDQDWNAALAAAQAGVDDYLYRLQQDQDYLQYSSPSPAGTTSPAPPTWASSTTASAT
jgi:Tfp pilus assembly protein PilX